MAPILDNLVVFAYTAGGHRNAQVRNNAQNLFKIARGQPAKCRKLKVAADVAGDDGVVVTNRWLEVSEITMWNAVEQQTTRTPYSI